MKLKKELINSYAYKNRIGNQKFFSKKIFGLEVTHPSLCVFKASNIQASLYSSLL